LALSGVNTYLGGTTVLAGVLQVACTGALPLGGSLTVGAGACVVLGGGLSAATVSSASSVAAAAGPSPVSTAVVAPPSVAVGATDAGPILPVVVPGDEPTTAAATVNVERAADLPEMRQIDDLPGASPRQVESLSRAQTQARDVVLQSLDARAAALWYLAGGSSGGPWDGKHDASVAVDAVMAALERMTAQ
jgi:autotransporter-associated beta strand protein